MTNNHLLEIKDYGQSIWMDHLNRNLIESGELQKMIETRGLRGLTSNPAIFESAIANAKIAYQKYKEIIQSDRWKTLAEKGANVQRLLWASTSTKNPDYSDVIYVEELIGRDTVNTLPLATIEACADHCNPQSDRIETRVEEAYQLFESLQEPDIKLDLDRIMDKLLEEGIDKFIQPFDFLMQSLENKIKQLLPV